ncbi:hypothetical protein [Streptomyces pristinaespiralis]|uniref:hypothetical protein n=1 Tax=Streptomyces pristinaespiralis TaxID=38300 RepID=UPI003835F2BA
MTALRDALAQHARLQSTTTWETLSRTVSPALAKYSGTGRMDLLVAVDTPLREHVPVLSALIRDNGQRSLPYLSRVLSELGVPHASSSVHIRRWAAVETDRAFAAYGVPSRAMPPRLSLLPTQPVTNRPTTAIREATPSRSLGLTQLQRPSARQRIPQQHALRAASEASTVRYLRALVAALEDLLPTLGKGSRKRARKALTGPKAWLARHDGAPLPKAQRAVGTGRPAASYLRPVEAALQAARQSIRDTERLREKQQTERKAEAEQAQRTAIVASTKEAAEGIVTAPADDAVARLRRQLSGVAAAGGTVMTEDLDTDATRSVVVYLLGLVDRRVTTDVAMLSALVTGRDGGPAPFFRALLRAAGLAVPQTDQALLMVWTREQQRAHAAYATTPRPLPPRLVPQAAALNRGTGG